MRTLLWVTPIAPCFDAGGGGEIRQAHLLDALADRFEIHLVVAGRLRDDRIRDRLRSVREIQAPVHADPAGRLGRRVRDLYWQLALRQPDEVARHRATRQALGRAIAEGPRHDVVCVEYVALAHLLHRRAGERWALTLHNLTSAMARHHAALAPGRRQRVMRRLEERNSLRIERWALGAYDLVVTPSPEDATLLGGAATVVPNGVDLRRFSRTAIPGEPRVVFTGALHTLPNREGIQWFCSTVWPRVRAEVSGARLDIVGSAPTSEVIALGGSSGVEVHADVPDVVPFLKHARLAVVPLRIGSGSRLKVLEAMAAGRPVAGTAIGVGGLDVVPGEDLLVGDDPDALARAVIAGLTDDALAQRLAKRGRALVERQYAWEPIGQAYAGLLERL